MSKKKKEGSTATWELRYKRSVESSLLDSVLIHDYALSIDISSPKIFAEKAMQLVDLSPLSETLRVRRLLWLRKQLFRELETCSPDRAWRPWWDTLSGKSHAELRYTLAS